MKTAVVFDSAGTLLNVYRVAKDVANGCILDNVESTDLVQRGRGLALVAMKVEAFDYLDGASPGQALSAFLAETGVGLDVICHSRRCTVAGIYGATRQDTTATIGDMRDAIAAVKLKCKDIYYVNMGFIVDVPRATIPYVLATGGRIFPGVKEVVGRLAAGGADVYIASGDNRRSLQALGAELGVPAARVHDALTPAGKKELVLSLKGLYDRVVMVGDGANDRPALEAADLGILTVQQGSPRPRALREAADAIVDDIRDVDRVLEKSLHNIDSTIR